MADAKDDKLVFMADAGAVADDIIKLLPQAKADILSLSGNEGWFISLHFSYLLNNGAWIKYSGYIKSWAQWNALRKQLEITCGVFGPELERVEEPPRPYQPPQQEESYSPELIETSLVMGGRETIVRLTAPLNKAPIVTLRARRRVGNIVGEWSGELQWRPDPYKPIQ